MARPDVVGEEGSFLTIRTMPVVTVAFEGESEFSLSLIEELGRFRILRSLYFNGLRYQRVKVPLECRHHEYVDEKPRISKWCLATLMGTIMFWACPLPVILRASYGRGRTVAGDGHYGFYLSIGVIADAPDCFAVSRGDFDMNCPFRMGIVAEKI
ncbi:hypothetical protein AVEN_46253-1 [Araneus ventricosus]|uniref:Uncharacterized protein n=1 Tax=Araneus ventricosus TaxID=182803 RepID=A0A4Y2FC24_ARAVE|nr:hypothetical protein AVEN_46253-1 [Araneus ventricosus]